MKFPFYFNADIEWGHLSIGPLTLTWFNSDTPWDNWGSANLCWDFNYLFLFFYQDRPRVRRTQLDPELRDVMKAPERFERCN